MRTVVRDIVGAFIFSSDDKLLLGKTGAYSGQWVIPGGGIEEGETKQQAVNREILEETGIDISSEAIEELDEIHTGESEKVLRDTGEKVLVKMTFFDYLIRLNQPAEKITVKAEDDFYDAKWFSKEELKNIDMSPPTIYFLKKLGYL